MVMLLYTGGGGIFIIIIIHSKTIYNYCQCLWIWVYINRVYIIFAVHNVFWSIVMMCMAKNLHFIGFRNWPRLSIPVQSSSWPTVLKQQRRRRCGVPSQMPAALSPPPLTESWRNMWLTARRVTSPFPQWRELADAISLLVRASVKYKILFTGRSACASDFSRCEGLSIIHVNVINYTCNCILMSGTGSQDSL